MKNTTKQSKPFSIFDFMKAIIDTKQPWDTFHQEHKKQFNAYMINRLLSMNPKYLDIVNYVQSLNIQDSKKLYEVYCFMIPKSKNTYSQYIKSSSKKALSPELLEQISGYFECSTKEAEEYIALTDKKWLENILTAKGIDEEEIKKLIK